MVAAGIMLMATFLPSESQTGLPATLPFLLAIALTSLGILGLRARYGRQSGKTGSIALFVGVLGGAAGVVSCLLWGAGYANGRALMNLCMAVMFAGLFVFGLAALRQKPMKRGNGLPVLSGVVWPLIIIGSDLYPRLTGKTPDVPFWASFTLFLAMSVPLALLGYRMQADVTPTSPAVA
jgi:FtsH-binding integral membrane protein